MTGAPKFLVVDGYTKKARDELAAGGAAVAGELYAAMLGDVSPGADCDIIYPSDPGAEGEVFDLDLDESVRLFTRVFGDEGEGACFARVGGVGVE